MAAGEEERVAAGGKESVEEKRVVAGGKEKVVAGVKAPICCLGSLCKNKKKGKWKYTYILIIITNIYHAVILLEVHTYKFK